MKITMRRTYNMQSLLRNLNLSRVNTVNNVVWWLTVNSAANALRSTKDLLAAIRQCLGERLRPHRSCNLYDFVESDIARVLNVLLLLPVPWRLCQTS